MKVKDKSFLGKLIIVVIGFGLSVLKWLNIMPNATITEIWAACGTAYGILLGTVDFNIIRDNETENKIDLLLESIRNIKKSILAKAFRGELGTNDPTEPPVEIA
jgi:hypothetical protein